MTESGVIKPDLSKTHMTMSNLADMAKMIPKPVPGGGALKLGPDWQRVQDNKMVMDKLKDRFALEMQGAGIQGGMETGPNSGRLGADHKKPSNYMVPKDFEGYVQDGLGKGKDYNQIVDDLWKSGKVKFIDAGFVATGPQVETYRMGGEMRTVEGKAIAPRDPWGLGQTGSSEAWPQKFGATELKPFDPMKAGELEAPSMQHTSLADKINAQKSGIADPKKIIELRQETLRRASERLNTFLDQADPTERSKKPTGIDRLSETSEIEKIRNATDEIEKEIERVKKLAKSPQGPKFSRGIGSKMLTLLPAAGIAAGAFSSKSYADEGSYIRAGLTGIGLVPGLEMFDLAAMGIDLGETVLWGKRRMAPSEEALEALMENEGIIKKAPRGFFGQPLGGGEDWMSVKDRALRSYAQQEKNKKLDQAWKDYYKSPHHEQNPFGFKVEGEMKGGIQTLDPIVFEAAKPKNDVTPPIYQRKKLQVSSSR